jgi:hypothetical protein
MLRVDLGATEPGEVNDSETVWLVSMTKENVINASSRGECDDGHTVEDVARRQLALKLGVQALRLIGVWPIPTLWQLMMLWCVG